MYAQLNSIISIQYLSQAKKLPHDNNHVTETETFVAFLKKAWKQKSRERKSFNDQHFNARRKNFLFLTRKVEKDI